MGNLHLVTGYSGTPHVASSDQGSLFEGLVRGGQFVMDAGADFSASIVTNNQIRVNDGELMMQGRYVKLTPGAYVDLAVENGAQGYLRTDLIAARYTKNAVTGVEECSLVVIKGTPAESNPADPAYTTGNLNAEGTLQHDFPLYRVSISGLVLEGLTALFEPEKSLYDSAKDNFVPRGFGYGETLPSVSVSSSGTTNAINTKLDEIVSGMEDNTTKQIRLIDNPNLGGLTYLGRVFRASGNYAVVDAWSYDGNHVRKIKNAGTWTAKWEYENPPLTVGTEYRTTERYKGSAVYKKVNSNGDILWRKDGETQWHLLSSASYVAAATVE